MKTIQQLIQDNVVDTERVLQCITSCFTEAGQLVSNS